MKIITFILISFLTSALLAYPGYDNPQYPTIANPWLRGPSPAQISPPDYPYNYSFPQFYQPHWQPDAPFGYGAPSWYYYHPHRQFYSPDR